MDFNTVVRASYITGVCSFGAASVAYLIWYVWSIVAHGELGNIRKQWSRPRYRIFGVQIVVYLTLVLMYVHLWIAKDDSFIRGDGRPVTNIRWLYYTIINSLFALAMFLFFHTERPWIYFILSGFVYSDVLVVLGITASGESLRWIFYGLSIVAIALVLGIQWISGRELFEKMKSRGSQKKEDPIEEHIDSQSYIFACHVCLIFAIAPYYLWLALGHAYSHTFSFKVEEWLYWVTDIVVYGLMLALFFVHAPSEVVQPSPQTQADYPKMNGDILPKQQSSRTDNPNSNPRFSLGQQQILEKFIN